MYVPHLVFEFNSKLKKKKYNKYNIVLNNTNKNQLPSSNNINCNNNSENLDKKNAKNIGRIASGQLYVNPPLHLLTYLMGMEP